MPSGWRAAGICRFRLRKWIFGGFVGYPTGTCEDGMWMGVVWVVPQSHLQPIVSTCHWTDPYLIEADRLKPLRLWFGIIVIDFVFYYTGPIHPSQFLQQF